MARGPSGRPGRQVGPAAQRGRAHAAPGLRGLGPANSAELGWRAGRDRGHGQRGRARGAHGVPVSGLGAGVRGGGPNMADPRPSGRPIGGTGGPGAGAVAPAANEGEAGPLPGPIPGGPRGGDPMAPRGADYLSGGARPTCGQWRRARPGSARQPEAVPGRPRAQAPGWSGPPGTVLPRWGPCAAAPREPVENASYLGCPSPHSRNRNSSSLCEQALGISEVNASPRAAGLGDSGKGSPVT